MRRFTDGLGVDGIFCAGTMGEFWVLTREDRKRAVEIVVEETNSSIGGRMVMPFGNAQ